MRHRESGLFLIEIVVVVVVVVVVTGMGAATRPRLLERQRQVESLNNVRNIAQLLTERSIRKGWPPYDGKNFVLSLVATHVVDVRNPDNLEVFFSPGDPVYALHRIDPGRYADITKTSLAAGEDFHELTSYAGRRNGDRDYVITADVLKRGELILCDDDDGPLHHASGIVAASTDGRARFLTWEDLEMVPPEDPDVPEPFLGDDASVEALRALSSD